jgi:hypothetical protein
MDELLAFIEKQRQDGENATGSRDFGRGFSMALRVIELEIERIVAAGEDL